MTGNVNLIIPASTTGGTATRVYIIQDATDRTTANKYTLSIKTSLIIKSNSCSCGINNVNSFQRNRRKIRYFAKR